MASLATQATTPSSQSLLNKKQAAAALGVSVAHFDRHMRASLPYMRSGQLMLYTPEDLERWIDSHASTLKIPSRRPTTRKQASGGHGRDQGTRWPV